MKRGFVRSVLLAFVLACCLQAIAADPVLADRGRNASQPEPTRLWSEFPLNPREQGPSRTKPAGSAAQGARATARDASDAAHSTWPLSLVLGLALTLAILAAGGIFFAVYLGFRPAWALEAAWRLPPHQGVSGARRPRSPSRRLSEGGLVVNKVVHRLLGGKRQQGESEPVAASSSEAAGSATRLETFTPYSMRGKERNEALHQSRNPTPENATGDAEKPVAETNRSGRTEIGQATENYTVVGEQVTAVLASAQQAAEQIRESARQEAERLRVVAKDKAAATLSVAKRDSERSRRESEKLRADAEVYSKETCGAADRYVAESRLKIDKEAAQRRAQVDEQVRGIRRAAEQKAKDIAAEALRRQQALVEEVGRSEARLQQLLGIFRGMTSQLEGLVKAGPARQSGDAEAEREESVAEHLHEALKPQPSPSRPR